MIRVCRPAVVLAVGLALAFAPAARAQQNKAEAVKITTIDGVELQGHFYASPKRNAPAVIVLHALGGDDNSGKKGWTQLAESLQKDYSVMLFDFRGHGRSTTVQPDVFWKFPTNVQHVKGAREKRDQISYKDFSKAYYPTLGNDIAAVKAFLDRQNDQKSANTSNTILIGAENGATLGAVWLNSEWHRFRMVGNPMIAFPQPASTPEGKDVLAAIWISPELKLGAYDVSLSKTLDVAARANATPTVFVYGEGDTRGKSIAQALEKVIKGREKNDSKFQFTAAVGIKGNAKLTGEKLLLRELGTDRAIKGYLDKVVDAKGREWVERDFRNTNYVWRLGAQFIPAKSPTDDSNLNFLNYEKYLLAR